MPRRNSKSLWSNLLLATSSLALTLLLLEFVVVPNVLPLLPLKIHAGLPRGFRVLAQSSKASTVPRDYIALLGDSYAQGMGDWLLSVNPNTNPPFHSAHLIHDTTGRDVVAFGMSGSGSLRALVTELPTTLEYLEKTTLFGVGEPDQIVVYFYEGNDLNDNLADLGLRFDPDYDRAKVRDREVFRKFLDDTVIGESPIHQEMLAFDWRDNFILTRFVGRVIQAVTTREWKARPEQLDFSIRNVNRGLVGGEVVPLPDLLQAPALDLGEEEIDLSLYVFAQALDYLVERFDESRIGVVYIPSPLASYRIASPRVKIQAQTDGDRADVYDRDFLARRSDRICAAVSEAARSEGVGFVDLRPNIWRATETEILHGPLDWKHLNHRGYAVLAAAVVEFVDAAGTSFEAKYFEGCDSFQGLLASVPVQVE